MRCSLSECLPHPLTRSLWPAKLLLCWERLGSFTGLMKSEKFTQIFKYWSLICHNLNTQVMWKWISTVVTQNISDANFFMAFSVSIEYNVTWRHEEHGTEMLWHHNKCCDITTNTVTSQQILWHHNKYCDITTNTVTSQQMLWHHNKCCDITTNTVTSQQMLWHHNKYCDIITNTVTSQQMLWHHNKWHLQGVAQICIVVDSNTYKYWILWLCLYFRLSAQHKNWIHIQNMLFYRILKKHEFCRQILL